MANFSLSDNEKKKLSLFLDSVDYSPSGKCEYINSLRKIAFEALPEELLDIFINQKVSINPDPYILIDNVPVDEKISFVPLKNESSIKSKSSFRSENLLILLSSILGEPYSMVFEGSEIVNNLISYPETKKDFTGLGSEVELDFHIENAALKHFGKFNFSPLGLMLTGVNYDENGPLTHVSDGREALKILSKKHRELLKQPLYKIKVPHRWRSADFGITRESTDWVPLVEEVSGGYPDLSAVFYHDMIEAKNEEANVALNTFHLAVKEVSFGLKIKPGQLIYIDNRFAMHAREKFTPTLDQDGRPKRWLQRVFVTPDLWGHRYLSEVNDRIYQVSS